MRNEELGSSGAREAPFTDRLGRRWPEPHHHQKRAPRRRRRCGAPLAHPLAQPSRHRPHAAYLPSPPTRTPCMRLLVPHADSGPCSSCSPSSSPQGRDGSEASWRHVVAGLQVLEPICPQSTCPSWPIPEPRWNERAPDRTLFLARDRSPESRLTHTSFAHQRAFNLRSIPATT